ncbi:MAG: efflux RND transporter periplasmic adaptor subunit [Balneolaceae bacterium]
MNIKIKMKSQLKTTIFGALVISSMILISACGGNETNQTPQGGFGGGGDGQFASVEVIPVQTGTISDQVRAFGTVRAQDVVQVTPQVSNRVTRILVDLGDEVSRGQVLAEIYDVPFRDAVVQAEAQISQARAAFVRDSTQLDRQRELFERDLVSQSEYDEFRTTYLSSMAQYESARAALTQSRENLENTKVKSPVNGLILNRSIAEGDIATTGQPIFEVANMVGFETRVFLPLQDWEQVQIGQSVSMRLSSRGNEIATGIVSRKSPQLNATTGLGEIVITLTDTGGSVHQGSLLQSNINLQTKENVVVIPRSALVEKVDTYIEPETGTIELNRSYSAFVSQGDSTAVQRELVLGIEQGDRIEVLDGLNPGDGLIITGQQSLENGSRIRVAGSNPLQPIQQADSGIDNMTPEQQAEMRERIQNMTPEERREFMQQQQAGGGGQGRGAGQGGGQVRGDNSGNN